MTATVAGVLAQAASRIGIKETPDGSNNVPGVTDWYGLAAAWCAMFVSRCLTDAGMPIRYAWCSSLASELERRGGRRFTNPSEARAGDVVFYEWGTTPGGFDHVGLVELHTLGGLVTIEGNVGNAVRRLNRPWGSGFACFVRPPYAPPPAPAGPPPDLLAFLDRASKTVLTPTAQNDPAVVKLAQALLNAKTSAGLVVDGKYGPATTAAVVRLQAGVNAWFRQALLVVDGKVGPHTWWWLTR